MRAEPDGGGCHVTDFPNRPMINSLYIDGNNPAQPAPANAFWNCGFPLIAPNSVEESHFHNINNGITESGHLKERC